MSVREKLTERMVKAAQPRDKDYHVFDAEVLGLALCVYKSGGRAFTFSYRFQGRQRRYTIGRWPEWSVAAARDRVKALRRQIDEGIDPMDARTDARTAPRVSDLVERYKEEHLPRLSDRNASDQRSMLDRFVVPLWKHRLVSEITPMDVDALLTNVAKGRHRTPKKGQKDPEIPPKPTPVRANRCGEVLRKMFNLAVKWNMITENPAHGFRKRSEQERERFLSPDEIERLSKALASAPDQRGSSIVRMCLLTGARLGEVRCARFEQFDLDHLIWTKQAAQTKQRRIHRIPISEDVASIIRHRRAALGVDAGWLFPGDAKDAAGAPLDKPVQDLRRFWRSIQLEADLPDVRMHDLRHTFASMLVSGGASLEMIGKLLGHTQTRTTQRYAHLMDSPLRAGVDHVAGMVQPPLRVVKGD